MPPHFFASLRPTQNFLLPLLSMLWPFSFPWPPSILVGIFQTSWGAGIDKAFCSEEELEQSKTRRFQPRKRYKFNIIKREMKRKTDSHQNCHVCDVWCWSRYTLTGLTGTFYPEPGAETGDAQNLTSFASLFLGSPHDREGCKALSYRLSIGRFDETIEKNIK